MDNIQRKVGRVRPPRVQITYDVETNGAHKLKSLPFCVLIIAKIQGDSKSLLPYRKRQIINITPGTISNVMEYLDVRLDLVVRKYNSADSNDNINIDLPLHCIDDFHPDSVISNVQFLDNLRKKLFLLKDIKRKFAANTEIIKNLSTLLKSGVNDRSSADNFSQKMDNQSQKHQQTSEKEKK